MNQWKRPCHARLSGMALTLFSLLLNQSCPQTAELGQHSCFCRLQISGNILLENAGHRLFAPRADLGSGSTPGYSFGWDCWCGLMASWQGLVQAMSEWTTKCMANK